MEQGTQVQVTYWAPDVSSGRPTGTLAVYGSELLVPRPVRARVIDPTLPCDVELLLDLDPDADRIVVVELTARRRAGGAAVTATMLRQLPVGRLTELALRAAALTSTEIEAAEVNSPPPDADALADFWMPQRGRRGRPRVLADSQLQAVAKVYRDHPDDGLVAVADEFGVGRTSAHRYVQRAAEAGYSIKQKKRRKR
jgi:hypothetical protein